MIATRFTLYVDRTGPMLGSDRSIAQWAVPIKPVHRKLSVGRWVKGVNLDQEPGHVTRVRLKQSVYKDES